MHQTVYPPAVRSLAVCRADSYAHGVSFSTTFEPISWDDERAVRIRDAFDAEMAERYSDGPPPGPELAQLLDEVFHTDPTDAEYVALALDGDSGEAVGHGALFRRPEPGTLELRRVTVLPEHRRRGHSKRLLAHLEDAARRLGASRIILDTGPKQQDAIALYRAVGYREIAPFPPYDRLAAGEAFCFEVPLSSTATARYTS